MHTVRKRETQVGSRELLDVWSADIRSLGDLLDAQDLDGAEACAVARSHVLVERVYGVRTGELAELFVHVVRARAGVVAHPDTEVLDSERGLL